MHGSILPYQGPKPDCELGSAPHEPIRDPTDWSFGMCIHCGLSALKSG